MVSDWTTLENRYGTFAIIGFVFGLMGFTLATTANAGIKKLKEELENLRKEVQALKEGGKEA